MTLTPAIKEAYDRVDSYVRNDPCFRYGSGHLCFKEDLDALLSVVAAEEGRKYTELVKLHREWVEACKAVRSHEFGAAYFLDGDPEGTALLAAAREAQSALAQWEAK